MHEIKCPHCSQAFKIDEAGYAAILKQVRDSDFEKQIHERLELAEQDKRKAVELAEIKTAKKEQQTSAAKEAEIQKLKAKLDSVELAQKLAVKEAVDDLKEKRTALLNDLEQAKLLQEAASKAADEKLVTEIHKTATSKNAEIQDLKAKLDATEVSNKLSIAEALSVVEKERDDQEVAF